MAESAAAGRGVSARRPSLSVWALATFDTVLFVLAALLPVHAVGALSDLLSVLGTLPGIVAFGYLWALFVLAVRWVLADATLDDPVTTLGLRGIAAGGVAGIAFLVSVVGVAAVPGVVAGSVRPLSVLLIALIGSAVAAVVGGVVGLLLGAVDLAVYRATGYVLPTGADRNDDAASATPDRQ